MLNSNMITILDPDRGMTENTIFGVWKKLVISQRLIWAENRSSVLFRDKDKLLEITTPGILGCLSKNKEKRLFNRGVICLIFITDLWRLKMWSVCWVCQKLMLAQWGSNQVPSSSSNGSPVSQWVPLLESRWTGRPRSRS